MPYKIKIDRTHVHRLRRVRGNRARTSSRLGDDNISVVVDPEGADEESVLDAARACPMDAITVLDQYEDQLWPA